MSEESKIYKTEESIKIFLPSGERIFKVGVPSDNTRVVSEIKVAGTDTGYDFAIVYFSDGGSEIFSGFQYIRSSKPL